MIPRVLGFVIVSGAVLGAAIIGIAGAQDEKKTPAAPEGQAPAKEEPGVETVKSGKTLLDETKKPEPLKIEEQAQPPAKPEKAPPLPFHNIEGYGGGAITPMAYLVNPGAPGTIVGLPSAGFTYVNMRRKDLEALTVSETLFRRVELSYALDRFGLGSLPGAIEDATGVDINRNQVYLHNFNIRTLLLDENAFNVPFIPAITGGLHFKINDGIGDVNRQLDGALSGIGLDNTFGMDFTFTASKTIPKFFGRPLILSAGLRNGGDAWDGFMGFSNSRATTFEMNVVYLPTDWLVLAYEFRQNAAPYDQIPGLVGKPDDWNVFDLAFIINKHCTLDIGYGLFGNMVNTWENTGLAVQFKYEF